MSKVKKESPVFGEGGAEETFGGGCGERTREIEKKKPWEGQEVSSPSLEDCKELLIYK
jgi:hypothetical protein